MPDTDDETVTETCGCVFCDLELWPEDIDGKLMHAVDDDIHGNAGYVPCTQPVQ